MTLGGRNLSHCEGRPTQSELLAAGKLLRTQVPRQAHARIPRRSAKSFRERSP